VTRRDGVFTALAGHVTDWAAWLAILAWLIWFLGHFPVFAVLALPAWVVLGIAVGLVRPWYGVLLTVVVLPFLGGPIDQPFGEILRVVPLYGAAVRVLVDRFIVDPSLGRQGRREPPWWVVAAAIAAAGLYALTVLTGFLDSNRDGTVLHMGVGWVTGGPVAMMAAWIAASHVVAGRDRTLTFVVLVTTVVACVAALAVWVGLPGVDLFTFPARVEGNRLGALGYPTPTAMGLATVLPLAVVAAWRIRRWLVVPVIALVLVTMILTVSRGPVIAVAVGAAAAVLASGRLSRRVAIAGTVVGVMAIGAVVVARYGTDPGGIIPAILNGSGEDVDRINTWIAALAIAAANPLFGGGWYALIRYGDFASRRIANSHNVLLDALAQGGLPLGITNAIVILWSAWMVWARRHTMAVWLVAAVVTWLVCGFWDIPQVRAYAAVMGGIVLGAAAGPLVARDEPAEAGADPARVAAA
jgi:hypothetical protein